MKKTTEKKTPKLQDLQPKKADQVRGGMIGGLGNWVGRRLG